MLARSPRVALALLSSSPSMCIQNKDILNQFLTLIPPNMQDHIAQFLLRRGIQIDAEALSFLSGESLCEIFIQQNQHVRMQL